MRYGKVIVFMEDGTRVVHKKVWIVRDIIDKDREEAKRISFFDSPDLVIKESLIKRVEYV